MLYRPVSQIVRSGCATVGSQAEACAADLSHQLAGGVEVQLKRTILWMAVLGQSMNRRCSWP